MREGKSGVKSSLNPLILEPMSLMYTESVVVQKWWSGHGHFVAKSFADENDKMKTYSDHVISINSSNNNNNNNSNNNNSRNSENVNQNKNTGQKRGRVELDEHELRNVKLAVNEIMRDSDDEELREEFINDQEEEKYEAKLEPLKLTIGEKKLLPDVAVSFFNDGKGPQINPSHDGKNLAWNWSDRAVRSILALMVSEGYIKAEEKTMYFQQIVSLIPQLLIEREKVGIAAIDKLQKEIKRDQLVGNGYSQTITQAD